MTDEHVHTHGPGGCGHTIHLQPMPLPPHLPAEHDECVHPGWVRCPDCGHGVLPQHRSTCPNCGAGPFAATETDDETPDLVARLREAVDAARTRRLRVRPAIGVRETLWRPAAESTSQSVTVFSGEQPPGHPVPVSSLTRSGLPVGQLVIDFTERDCGIELTDWQRRFLLHWFGQIEADSR